MRDIVSWVVSTLVLLGIAWGLIQYLGDGTPFLSDGWFDNGREKIERLQDETSDDIVSNLPNPDAGLSLPETQQ